MSQDNDLDFSNLEPIEIEIPYAGQTLYLREATEDVHKKYKSAVMKAYKNVNGDMVIANPDAVAELPSMLVGSCLFTERGGNPEKKVKPDIIKAMPTRAVARMFARLRRISGMDAEEVTVESLEKQIAELTRQLEELKAREESGESHPTS